MLRHGPGSIQQRPQVRLFIDVDRSGDSDDHEIGFLQDGRIVAHLELGAL